MTLDDRLKRAIDSLGDKLRDEIAKELATLDLAPPQTAAAADRLVDGLRAIDQAASLSDILETLSTLVSMESARSGVFVMSGERLRGFRVVGIPDEVDRLPSDLKSFPLELAGSQIGAVYVEIGADLAAIEILTRFASRALQAMTALKTARAVAEGQIA